VLASKQTSRKSLIGWLIDDSGAVSIYLVISTAAVLLFTSVLIDYARVAAYNKQVELAAQSAIRSALSAYDGPLYERYGLFGNGGTDRNEIFAHAAKNNWLDSKQAGFQLLDIRYLSSKVQEYETLGRYDVFKRQVLEEMKYKAPIDFTLEVASKFAPVATAMKEASAAVGMMEKLRKVYDKREASLTKLLGMQREAAKATSTASSLIPFSVKDAMTGDDTAASIVGGYSSYLSWIAHDAYLKEKELPLYTESIRSYETRARILASNLQSKSMAALRRHQDLEGKMLKELAAAERYNGEMQEVIRQARQEQSGGGFDRASKQKLPGGSVDAVPGGDLKQLQETTKSVDELLLAPAWFETYRNEISAQTTDYASFDSEAAGFQSSLVAAIGGMGSELLLAEGVVQLRIAFEQYDRQYSDQGTVIGQRIREREARTQHDAERKKQEDKAKSAWKEARKLLHSITSIPQLSEHQEMFDQAGKRYSASLAFNQRSSNSPEDEVKTGTPEEEAGDAADGAMTSMGSMFGGMADMLEGMRDTLYINEYTVQRFSRFDPQKLGAVFKNGDMDELSHALNLNNQETEYILYGFQSPTANLAAAYGELFAVRLAVRTMEGFIVCQSMGHPLLILAGAIVYGLEQAMADLLKLVSTGSTPLSKYAPVEISYKDYLRLFLLVHGGGGEGRMARIIAVIEHNTGMALATTPTGLSGELKTSVNLWFLPSVIRGLAATGLLGGKVSGSRYETTRTIGLSYS